MGTPAATFPPKKGRRRKEVCPPRIDTHTETVRKKANEEEQPANTPPHGGGQYMSRKAPYRPESGSTKVSANASMKASRPCSAPRKGWPGYLNRKGSYQETYASCLSRPCAVGTTGPNQREKQGGQVFTTHHPLMKAPRPLSVARSHRAVRWGNEDYVASYFPKNFNPSMKAPFTTSADSGEGLETDAQDSKKSTPQ